MFIRRYKFITKEMHQERTGGGNNTPPTLTDVWLQKIIKIKLVDYIYCSSTGSLEGSKFCTLL